MKAIANDPQPRYFKEALPMKVGEPVNNPKTTQTPKPIPVKAAGKAPGRIPLDNFSPVTDKTRLSSEARREKDSQKSPKTGLRANLRELKKQISASLKGKEKDLSLEISYGKEKKVKFEGQEVLFKGDGKLDAFITDKLAQRPGLMAKGIITDIKDPRITKLLADPDRLNRLRADGEGNRGREADAEFGKNWKVGRSLSSSTSGGKTYEMDNLELYNPELEGGFSLNKVTVCTGQKAARGDHFVILEGAGDKVFAKGLEKITAAYDPKTGKIKDETIHKWIYRQAPKAE